MRRNRFEHNSISKMFCAYPIIAVDIVENKLDAAKRFGATHVIDARSEDPVKAAIKLTEGGVDKAFEAIGNPKTSDQIIQATRPGGTATIMGARERPLHDQQRQLRHPRNYHHRSLKPPGQRRGRGFSDGHARSKSSSRI